MEALKDSLFNNYLLFQLNDKRKVYGMLKSVDNKGNAMLKDVIVEYPTELVSPLNEHLVYEYDRSKDFASRLPHFFKEPKDKTLNFLEPNSFCTDGIILPSNAIDSVHKVIKQ